MRRTAPLEVRQRLTDPDLPARIEALGFRGADGPDLLHAATTVRDRPDALGVLATMADRLVDRLGQFPAPGDDRLWGGLPATAAGLERGVLPMLALLATAPEVATYHAGRGVPDDISAATLADLGQQVWVHRLVYGKFGLHTQGWLTLVWSGALYRLGRLQFNLHRRDGQGEWQLQTHIPRGDPLTPASAEASFAEARAFFATHFPDYPTRDFFCRSWLLDPALPELLPRSNLAAFQQRWHLEGDPGPGEADVLFFVFNRRESTLVEALPTDTTLRRAIAAHLRAGRGWSQVSGRFPQ